MFAGQFLYTNDIAGKHPDSYYAASANTVPEFPQQRGKEETDVCVVGAGFTGLSTALHLAKSGYSVCLVDAHKVGWGASGRNGGQLGTGQRVDQETLEKEYGKTHARQLWDVSVESVELCKTLINEHKIACDLTPGILHADHRKRFVPETQAYVEKLQQEYEHDSVRFVDQSEIRQMVGSDSYYGGSLDMSSAHIHPLNFAIGLARAAANAGVKIYEHSPVFTYTEGKSCEVNFEKGTIKSSWVVLACNGYLDKLNKKVASKVMPINNFIVATEPLDDAFSSELIRDNIAVADSKFVVNYFRLSADRRMLFGGGENYSFNFPKDIKQTVVKPMLEIYPQLRNTRIEYAWGGTLAITMNRMPYMTRLSPSVLSASGYSGHGVGMATLAGKMMAEVVDGTLGQFDIMQKIPASTFPGGTLLRWPGLVLAMTYYAIRDKL